MRKRPGWKILVSRGGEENWAERGDSKVVGQGNDRRIFLSFFLLAELFPIPRQYSGKKKRIGWRKVGKEKNRKRERERGLTWLRFGEQHTGGPTPRGKRQHSQRKWTDGLEAARLHLEQNRNPVVYIPARSFSARVRARHESADGKSSLSAGLRQLRSDLRFLSSAKCNLVLEKLHRSQEFHHHPLD